MNILTELLISPDRLVFRTFTFRRSVLLITQSRVMKWDHPNGTAMLNGVHIIWNTDWMATQTWQQMHIKTQRYIKHQRSWARGSDWGDLSPLLWRCRRAARLCVPWVTFAQAKWKLGFPIFGLTKNVFTWWRQSFQNPRTGRVYRRGEIWDIFRVLVFKDI